MSVDDSGRFKQIPMGVYLTAVTELTRFRRYWVDKHVLEALQDGDARQAVIADLGAGNGARGGSVLQALLRAGHDVDAHLLDMDAGALAEAVSGVLPEALDGMGGALRHADERSLHHTVPNPCGPRPAMSFSASAQVGSVTELPYEDGSFHAVMCELVLHWLADAGHVRQALREIHRVLRPGGTALLAVLTPWNRANVLIEGGDPDQRWAEVGAWLAAHPGEPFPGRFPDPQGLPLLYYPEQLFRDEVQRAGLSVAALELLGADLYRHPDVRDGFPGSLWLAASKPAIRR